ncbi:Leucine-rich repeat - like 10 [Theobroma cacao]|nr:Leucine-rich repeat - like 10 [Theobroma cacao]
MLVIFDLHSIKDQFQLSYIPQKLKGELPPSICHMRSIEILDLSNNNLNGTIPKCLANLNNLLTVLDLRINNFHGTIPGKFSKCRNLMILGLNKNQLGGSLLNSLLHCKELEILDLENNKIIGTLPKLKVLVLRSNKF